MQYLLLPGIGCPLPLYQSFINNLASRSQGLQAKFINWWNLPNCGQAAIAANIKPNTKIIAHSAGGVIALQCLLEYKDNIDSIVLLDSHFKHSADFKPKMPEFLETTLSVTDNDTAKQVRELYEPVMGGETLFYQSFADVTQWCNQNFESSLNYIKQQSTTSVKYYGFSDNSYKPHSATSATACRKFWQQYNVSVNIMPMNHFDLLIPAKSRELALTMQY